jgi:hypothetical protein
MIDVQTPESKPFQILSGQAMSKARSSANFQIIDYNYGTDRRVAEGEEKRVLAFGWIRRAIHENEAGLFEAPENIGVTREIEGFDQSKSVPAALERDNGRLVGRAVRQRSGIGGINATVIRLRRATARQGDRRYRCVLGLL